MKSVAVDEYRVRAQALGTMADLMKHCPFGDDLSCILLP